MKIIWIDEFSKVTKNQCDELLRRLKVLNENTTYGKFGDIKPIIKEGYCPNWIKK